MIGHWRQKVNFTQILYIQRSMHRLIRERRILYGKLVKKWSFVERSIRSKKRKITTEFFTPNEIKVIYLRRALKQIMREFNAKIEE